MGNRCIYMAHPSLQQKFFARFISRVYQLILADVGLDIAVKQLRVLPPLRKAFRDTVKAVHSVVPSIFYQQITLVVDRGKELADTLCKMQPVLTGSAV